MGAEHDSWFEKAFGVDPSTALKRVEDSAAAAVEDVKRRGSEVVQGVQQVVSSVVDQAVDSAKKVVGPGPAAKPPASAKPGPRATAPAPTGSFPLRGSVGKGGTNRPADVSAVQTALNRHGAGLAVDGVCGSRTVAAIVALEKKLGSAQPTGLVAPGGAAERALTGRKAKAVPAPKQEGGGNGESGLGGFVDGAVKRAQEAAGEVVDGLSSLGERAVQGLKSVLDDPGALLDQMPRPSYVANPDPPSSLGGGAKASAGDSYFVTGGQQSQLVSRIKGIVDTAKALDKVAQSLEKKATAGWWDDKQLLQSAKSLHAAASATMKLAKQLDNWTGDGNKAGIDKGSKAVDYVDKIIKAAELVGSLRSLSLATDELEKKTSERTVNAWADSVGDTFEKAGAVIDLIPKGVLPGFMVDYYKGLFSAPKNFISAFKTMLSVHYGTVNEVAGRSEANKQAFDLHDAKVKWEGALTPIYVRAYTLPRSPLGAFEDFMKSHRKTEGADLYTVALTVGRALLMTAIDRDVAEGDPARDAWVRYVAGF